MTHNETERKLSDATLESQRFYVQNYDLIAWIKQSPAKIFIGDPLLRSCRFCHRTSSNTSFKTRAHAFPEFIGNRFLFANDECDSCNSRFAVFETHFSRYLGLELTISQIKGKERVPKYKVRSEGPSVTFDASANKLLAEAHVDDQFIDIDTANDRATIRWQRQGYIRRLAFKCLVKMALSIMPAEVLPIFAETSRWLVGDDLVPGSACFIMVRSRSAGSIPGIEAALLTRRIGRKDLPYASFFLHFYNFSFQIFLPFSSRDTDLVSRDVNIARFPSRMESLCDVFYLTEDMSSTEWLRGETAELNLRYDGPISFGEVTA